VKVARELRWEGGKVGRRQNEEQGGGCQHQRRGSLRGRAACREMSASHWYSGPLASSRAEILISFPNGYRHCLGAVDPIKDSY